MGPYATFCKTYLIRLRKISRIAVCTLPFNLYLLTKELSTGNACDTYCKKRTIVKVLKGSIWEQRLLDYVGHFAMRKQQFLLALNIRTASSVDNIQTKVFDLMKESEQNGVILQKVEARSVYWLW
jgi:hypothetical protein